jgi:hypothetical protein
VPVTVTGVTDDVVPAGTHTIQIGIACASSGSPTGTNLLRSRVQASVVVLG